MTISDLQPGDRVTFRGEPYFLETHLGDGMNSILQWADDPKYHACVPSALEVVDGKIDDRRYGAGESKGPGANATSRRDTYGGDPPTTEAGATAGDPVTRHARHAPESAPGPASDQPLRRGTFHGLVHSPARRTAHEPTPGDSDQVLTGFLAAGAMRLVAFIALFATGAMIAQTRPLEAGVFGLVAILMLKGRD